MTPTSMRGCAGGRNEQRRSSVRRRRRERRPGPRPQRLQQSAGRADALPGHRRHRHHVPRRRTRRALPAATCTSSRSSCGPRWGQLHRRRCSSNTMRTRRRMRHEQRHGVSRRRRNWRPSFRSRQRRWQMSRPAAPAAATTPPPPRRSRQSAAWCASVPRRLPPSRRPRCRGAVRCCYNAAAAGWVWR